MKARLSFTCPGRLHDRLYHSFPEERRWIASLSLAVAVHLVVFLAALVAPHLVFRPRLPEVYTVNLFNVEEIAPGPERTSFPPPVVAPAKAKKKVPAPTENKKTPPASHKQAVREKIDSSPRPISTRPIKVKTKADVERLQALKEKLLALELARKAEEEASKAAREAVEALKESLAVQKEGAEPPAQEARPSEHSAPSSTGGGTVEVDPLLRRYLVSLHNHIQSYWALPGFLVGKEGLTAVVVVRIRRDGVVREMFFERKSDNLYYNGAVEKVLKDASPLPPFPAQLKEEELEIGLRFNAKGLMKLSS